MEKKHRSEVANRDDEVEDLFSTSYNISSQGQGGTPDIYSQEPQTAASVLLKPNGLTGTEVKRLANNKKLLPTLGNDNVTLMIDPKKKFMDRRNKFRS